MLILLAFSVFGTWFAVYLRMVEFLDETGIDANSIGHVNIAIEVLDVPVVFFGSLVFLAAGVIPLAVLFVRANAMNSIIAQLLWALLIVGLLAIALATS